MALDEELIVGLKLARKGKACHFCLIAKGPEVLKLIVQKKRIPSGDVKNAKSEFKGNNVIQGIVVGDGPALTFEVVDSEPSIKTKKIKDYVDEHAELKVHPSWSIATALREVQEDDESEGSEFDSSLAPPTAPPPPPEMGSPPSPPVAPPPPPSGQTPPDAPLPPSGPTSTTSETSPPAPPPEPLTDNLLAELVGKMNKLSKAIQSAAAAHPARKADLIKPVAAFQARVKAKDAAGAQEALREVAAVLKELTSGGGAPPTPPQAPPESTQGETPPAPPPPQAETGKAQENESVEDENEEKASQFRREWAAARKNLRAAIDDVEAQLATFADALLKSNDPNMEWVAEQGLTQLLGGLRASATTIDKSAAKSPEKIAKFARPALGELEKRLDSPQVRACDENKFGAKVTIKRTIDAALREMSQTLDQAS
jgi:hypothetical protein